MTSVITSSLELPGSNPVMSHSRRTYQPATFLPFSSSFQGQSPNFTDTSLQKRSNFKVNPVNFDTNHVNKNFLVKPSHIIQCLNKNKQLLDQCGFYYEGMNSSQSTELLRKTSEGTFLVRDSSDSQCMYTLSVQRTHELGPTSVRIYFAEGKFKLDANDNIKKFMPTFDSISDLVKHYCGLSKNDCVKSQILVDNENLYSEIFLRKPLNKKVSELAHSARLTQNQVIKS